MSKQFRDASPLQTLILFKSYPVSKKSCGGTHVDGAGGSFGLGGSGGPGSFEQTCASAALVPARDNELNAGSKSMAPFDLISLQARSRTLKVSAARSKSVDAR